MSKWLLEFDPYPFLRKMPATNVSSKWIPFVMESECVIKSAAVQAVVLALMRWRGPFILIQYLDLNLLKLVLLSVNIILPQLINSLNTLPDGSLQPSCKANSAKCFARLQWYN